MILVEGEGNIFWVLNGGRGFRKQIHQTLGRAYQN